MLNELTTFGLLAFTSFLAIIDPIGIMPVYLTMTASLTPAERSKTARKAVIVAFFAIVLFAFTGQFIFKFFSISINSLRIVGGIIFFMMGYDMLQAKLVRTNVDENFKKQYINDISITPLAIPMLCGPGAIANSIVLMEDAVTWQMQLILIAAIAAVCFLVWVSLTGASKVNHLLGDTGTKIMMRLMGLIIMVIAVEFFFSGLKPMVQGMMK